MAIETTDGNEAARIALHGLTQGEAPRVGVLGDSGVGKSIAMMHLIQAWRKAMPKGLVLIVDDKGPKLEIPIKGQERQDVVDLKQNPLNPTGPQIITFRGDPYDLEQEVDPEDIAKIQWTLSRARPPRPTLAVYDELDKACNYAQWKYGDRSVIRWTFKKGRAVGTSVIWGTQETQGVPADAFNQSSTILAFKMVGTPVRLLKERQYLEGGADRVLPQLPGDDVPKSQRGHFLLLRRGRIWDGKIYRFAHAANGKETVSG